MKCKWILASSSQDIYWELEDFDLDDEEYRTTPRPTGFLDNPSNVSLKDIFKKKNKNDTSDSLEASQEDHESNSNTDIE